MSPDLWISAALSVPIGIGTGLAIAPIQRWYAGRGITRQAARLNRAKEEYNDTLTYLRFPEIYNQFHLKILISMLEGTSVWLLGAVSVLMVIGDQIYTKTENLPTAKPPNSFPVIGLIIAGIGMTLGIAIFMKALDKYKAVAGRLASFVGYVETVPPEIRDATAEEACLKSFELIPPFLKRRP